MVNVTLDNFSTAMHNLPRRKDFPVIGLLFVLFIAVVSALLLFTSLSKWWATLSTLAEWMLLSWYFENRCMRFYKGQLARRNECLVGLASFIDGFVRRCNVGECVEKDLFDFTLLVVGVGNKLDRVIPELTRHSAYRKDLKVELKKVTCIYEVQAKLYFHLARAMEYIGSSFELQSNKEIQELKQLCERVLTSLPPGTTDSVIAAPTAPAPVLWQVPVGVRVEARREKKGGAKIGHMTQSPSDNPSTRPEHKDVKHNRLH